MVMSKFEELKRKVRDQIFCGIAKGEVEDDDVKVIIDDTMHYRWRGASDNKLDELIEVLDKNWEENHATANSSPIGTKLDKGKLKPTLLLDDMPLAINEILKVLQFGAEKYSEGNWLKVDNGISRYRNAADRHRLATDELDDESGLLHLAHEATSVLMLLELKLKEKRDAEQTKRDT